MKNSEQKKLDQILKDKLSEGTAQVPDFVWDRIEEELFPKKKRRFFFWWFFGGLCTLLIGVLIAIAVSGGRVLSQKNTLPDSTSGSNNLKNREDEMFLANKRRSTKSVVVVSTEKREDQKGTFLSKDITKEHNSAVSTKQHATRHLKFRSKTETSRSKSTSHSNLKRKSSSSQQLSSTDNNTAVNAGSERTFKTQQVPVDEKTNSNISVENTIPGKPAAEVENEKPKGKIEPKDEVLSAKELSYAEILQLIQRDFPKAPDKSSEQTPFSCVSIGVYGGPSLYHTAAFKDYFTSGQLSKRTFASSGYELGFQTRVKLGNRFRVYAGLAFNQKQTQFTYNVAITEADYFTYVENGEKVPLENIHDDGMNSCFLAKDVTAKYQLKTISISLGTSFEFLRIGKFSAAADLRLSGNLSSSLKLQEMLVLDIAQPRSEKFSYLQPGAGLLLNYRLNRRISLGLAPFFSKQFYLKNSFSRKLEELVIPLSVSFEL